MVQSVRETVGSAYPVLIKINSEDFLPGGMSSAEAVEVSGWLGKASIDAIEFSGGTMTSPEEFVPVRPGRLKTPEQEVYYRQAAILYKQKVTIPLMLVGGIRSYEVAEELVRDGTADYISLSRPLICEPGSSSAGGKATAAKPNVFQTMPALGLHWMARAFTA